MPQVDLSTLSGVELRQLLDTSRRRGDAALSYKVLQEMAVRRDAPAERRRALAQGPAEPHLIEVELGDPADEDDDLPPMPNWRPPAHAAEAPPPVIEPPAPAEDAEPAPVPLDANRPLSLWEDSPARTETASVGNRASRGGRKPPRRPPAKPAGPKSAYRPRLRLVLGFALGIAAGTALGFWVGQMPTDTPPRPAPAAAPIQTAALTPPPPVEPAAVSPAAPVPDAQPDPTTISPAAQPNAQEAVGDADSHASEPSPPSPPAEPVRSAEAAAPAAERPVSAAVASGCASAPTPADRAICGDAKLRRLQDELRRAYAEALEAHEDRTLLREHQLAWRDARNAVTDPGRLATLYEERIRKLNAATAEALRAR